MHTFQWICTVAVTSFVLSAAVLLSVIIGQLWHGATGSERVAAFFLTGILASGIVLLLAALVTMWALLLTGGGL